MVKPGMVLIGVTTVVVMIFHASTTACDSERELRDAVSSMNSWLGAGQNGRHWRQFLHLNVLDTQSALGNRADRRALFDVGTRFETNVNGLSHPVFRRVKSCIDAHLDQLTRNQIDIAFAAEQAKFQFQQFSREDLDRLRDDAVYKIKMLKRFYKVRFASRQRALLYYELEPEESIKFLNSIEFEIPPSRSKAVIESEIRVAEEEIEAIELQIEQLNEQRNKILEWMKKIDADNRKNLEPPMPDDGDEQEEELRLNSADGSAPPLDMKTESLDMKTESKTASNPQRQGEIKNIETVRTILLQKQQDLKDQISELQDEIKQQNDSERERISRFRMAMRQLNSFLRNYEKLRTDRNDVYFEQAFESLIQMKTAYLMAANPATEKQFLIQLARLRKACLALSAENGRRAAAELGAATGWLENAGQTADLVSAIRTRYSLPNLYLEVSNFLVNELAGRNVNEVRRVNEQILSRLIKGKAYVDGKVSVQFVPDPNQVRAAIDFTGTIESDTYTRAGKLTAYAGANGQFSVRREVLANIGGMFACDISGDIGIDSYFKSIDSKLRLVQKIARKQYQKTKFKAEAISRQRTRSQLFPQFKAETDKAIDGGYEQFNALSSRQTDTHQLLPALYMFTASDRLIAVGHRATSYDLAATSKPSDSTSIPVDVHVRVHESLLSNYISPLLAGKKFSNREIAAQFQQVLGQPVAADDGADADDFSISFDDTRPIQIEFENNTFVVTISGKEFSRDGKKIRDGLRIRLVFKIERIDGKLRLAAAPEAEVELINKNRKNIATVSFMSFLEDRLADALAEASESDFEIPENLIPLDKLGPNMQSLAKNLDLVQLRTETGWLYIGWNHRPDSTFYQYLADTPAIWNPVVQLPVAYDSSQGVEDGLNPTEENDAQ